MGAVLTFVMMHSIVLDRIVDFVVNMVQIIGNANADVGYSNEKNNQEWVFSENHTEMRAQFRLSSRISFVFSESRSPGF